MTFGIVFTIGSLLFLIALMITYFSKVTFKQISNQLYRLTLILALVFAVTEIGSILLLKYVNIETITHITFKLHWTFGVLMYLVFFIYLFSLVYKYNYKNLLELVKKEKTITIITAVFVGVLIVYWFLPFKGLDINDLNFFPSKLGMIIVTVIFFIISVLLVIVYIKSKKDLPKNVGLIIFFNLGTAVISYVSQVLFNYISFLPLGAVVDLLFAYYFLENPDLQLLSQLLSVRGEIEKSNKTKTDFLSNMTYEIKIPMNSISSISDALFSSPTFDEKSVREDIQQIYDAGTNLVEIVNNILDISKIETGKDSLQERDYAINDMVVEVTNMIKSKLGAKPVQLVVNIDQNISSKLNGDSAKLYQSILNIMTNSVKYTDVGKITLTLTSSKTNNVENLLFKVSDTGSGIKQEDYDKLFTKFSRLDNAVEKEIDGSGLGLAITKNYVTLMGGRIWFESQYRVGTTFYIEVPQKIVDPKPISEAIKEVKKPKVDEKLDCSAYTAFIVDDNNLNIKVAKRLLEQYKFKVESVTNGKDCIYKVKEGMQYDIIFMDHMMPEMDGIETLHVLKKLDGYKLPPIVALTANAITGMKEMYLNEGFDEYLSKPINTNELDRILNKYFNKDAQ